MDMIKKNILSILCGVVALAALIAIFWPLGSWLSTLEADVQQRADVGRNIDSLLTSSREMPIVDPQNPERQTLNQFPSKPIVDWGKRVTEHVQEESRRMLNAAVEINRRDQLVSGALPQGAPRLLLQFRRSYANVINNVLPNQILKAGRPLTNEDIQQAEDELWVNEYARRIHVEPGTGRELNREQVNAEFDLAASRLPEKLKQDIARTRQMYVDLDAFHADPRILEGRQTPDPVDIWYAQVGLWIQEDVARAIARANEGSRNVASSPVKRLLRIEVPDHYVFAGSGTPGSAPGGFGGYGGYGMDYGMEMNGGGAPPAASTDFSVSPTGRVSGAGDALYDVVHFHVEVHVEAAKIPLLLHELGRNQFITVLSVDEISGVDSALEQANGYLYGNAPMASVRLTCEALFLREWTMPLMPQEVKEELGLVEAPQEGQDGSGWGAGMGW